MIKNNLQIWPRAFSSSNGKSQIFKGLSEESLQKILENSTLQHFKKGQLLVQQGDTPSYIYLVIKGSARSFRSNTDGDETTIRMLAVGDTCMETSIFMGGISPVTLQTTENSQLILIPSPFIKNFVLQNPQFAMNILKIMAQHYQNSIQQIDSITLKSPTQSVGYYFLQKHLEQGSDNTEFELPFKKSTIANHLGITPETFSRALGQLKKMGLEIEGEKIRIKEAFALCHFCDLDTAQNCTLSDIAKLECPHCPLHTGTHH